MPSSFKEKHFPPNDLRTDYGRGDEVLGIHLGTEPSSCEMREPDGVALQGSTPLHASVTLATGAGPDCASTVSVQGNTD